MVDFTSAGVDDSTKGRILEFLNRVGTALDIARAVNDHPGVGRPAGYGIGLVVAQRILDRRATLSGFKFTDLSQLSNIKGFGEDKFTDLVYSFGSVFYPEPTPAPYDFKEAAANNAPGLWWLEKKGEKFLKNRPIIIFIHGCSGVPQGNNTYWQSNRFQNWNAGVFNWSDYNKPACAYGPQPLLNKVGKAHQLFLNLKDILEHTGYDNNEIRFAGYSWGMHVASYAAKKLMRYVKEINKKILVSVDLLDPVDASLSFQNDEGIWKSGTENVKDSLKYVAENQVVGIKPHKKLFTFVIEKWYSDAIVLRTILPHIRQHAEVYQDGISHCDFWHGCLGGCKHSTTRPPPNRYKECNWQNYDETKILPSTPYVPGAEKIKVGWLDLAAYNPWAHGPEFAARRFIWSWELPIWEWHWEVNVWHGFVLQYSDYWWYWGN